VIHLGSRNALWVTNLVCGESATLETTGGVPYAKVAFFATKKACGQTVIGGKVMVNLVDPIVLGIVVANKNGRATLTRPVRQGLCGKTAYFRAVEATSGEYRTSHPVGRVIQ
jgi:hypothetical protein